MLQPFLFGKDSVFYPQHNPSPIRMKRPSAAALSRAPIVLVCDVKIPKRAMFRYVAPNLRDGAGNPMARLKFLTRPPRDGEQRFDRLSDQELALVVEKMYQEHWQGKICLLCTADQGFYDVARGAIRKSSIVLIKLPLFGKKHLSSRRVLRALSDTLVPLVHKAFDKYHKHGLERAWKFCERRARDLRTIQG